LRPYSALTTFKHFLCLALLIGALAADRSGSAAAAEKVYIAGSSAESVDMFFHVAKKKGFFQSEGLDVDLIVARPNISIAGMAGKNIDYGTVLGSLLRAALGGLPVRLVMISMDRPSQSLVARPDIKTIDDLRGKTVGVSGIGGMADVITRMMLERAGLAPGRDVQIAPLGPMAARINALQNGVVAAAPVTPPMTYQLEKTGYKILLNASDLVVVPYYGLGTSVDKMHERPGQVKALIRAFLQAGRFIRNEKSQMISILMDSGQMERGIAEKSYQALRSSISLTGEPSGEGMQFWLDVAKKERGMKEDIPMSQVADFTILRTARNELGIR
jgi:ABC-type nitrate/sulfonate/bicarbonate transport system substrate-binding protein